MQLGINVASPADSSGVDWKFNDAVLAGDLVPGPIPPGQFITTQASNYVRPGIYTVSCGGTGKLQIMCNGVAPGTQMILSFPGGPYPIDVVGTQGLNFLAAKDAALSDLSVIVPGAGGTGIWHPDYVTSLQTWSSLRGMDYLYTNYFDPTQTQSWEQRQKVRPGWQAEGFVGLATAAGAKEVWVNIPVNTVSLPGGLTDYCTQLGLLLQTLPAGTTVRLEFGNEVWNSGAAWIGNNYAYLHKQGQLIYDPTMKAVGGAQTALAALGATAFDEVRNVAGNNPGLTFRRVAAGFTWVWGSTGGRLAQLAASGSFGAQYDDYAIAPYLDLYGSGTQVQATVAAIGQQVAAGNVSGAIDTMCASLTQQIPVVAAACQQWQAEAKAAGGSLVYYEMGLNIGGLWAFPGLMQSANYDPRLGSVVAQYLAAVGQYATVGHWFTNCMPRQWGMKQNIDDNSNVVYQACLAYAQANP